LCFLKVNCSDDSSQLGPKLLESAGGRLLSWLQASWGFQFRCSQRVKFSIFPFGFILSLDFAKKLTSKILTAYCGY
jgi:hypothetical protein